MSVRTFMFCSVWGEGRVRLAKKKVCVCVCERVGERLCLFMCMCVSVCEEGSVKLALYGCMCFYVCV